MERESEEEILGYLHVCAFSGRDDLAFKIIQRLTPEEVTRLNALTQPAAVDECIRRLEQLAGG